MTGIFSTKLPKVEWLFKQSSYGGPEHIMVNVDDFAAYIESRDFKTALRIQTVCAKNLKYNAIFSVVRQKEGLIRNICPDCILQYDSSDKQMANENRQEQYIRENDDIPF